MSNAVKSKVIPEGFYWSKLCGMALRKRQLGSPVTVERHTMAPSSLLRRALAEISPVENDANEAKKLTSEDASRYGSALWSGKLKEYFSWRAEQGLSWWHEQERLYPSAANDNSTVAVRKAA